MSLTAKGLTTGEVAAHFQDIYGASVSKDTISRIADKVVGEMTEWCNRPLEPVYPVVFIDAIHVKIRDGQVTNRPVYVAIGVTCAGERDILGLWAGDGGEGAKFWLAVLTEIKNRGGADVWALPTRSPRPRALSDRTGRDEMSLSRDPFPGPHRPR